MTWSWQFLNTMLERARGDLKQYPDLGNAGGVFYHLSNQANWY